MSTDTKGVLEMVVVESAEVVLENVVVELVESISVVDSVGLKLVIVVDTVLPVAIGISCEVSVDVAASL